MWPGARRWVGVALCAVLAGAGCGSNASPGSGASADSGAAGAACDGPPQPVGFQVDAPDGGGLCSNGYCDQLNEDADGRIVASDNASFTLDDCDPTTACTPDPVRVEVDGTEGYPPVGTLVHATWHGGLVANGFTGYLEIDNLTAWHGAPNPVESGTTPWLAVQLGGRDARGPYTITSTAACRAGGCGPGRDIERLALMFASLDGSQRTPPLKPGQSAQVPLFAPTSKRAYNVFVSDAFDNPCDPQGTDGWFYAISPAP